MTSTTQKSMKGLVVKNTGSWYQVQAENGDLAECKMKGNLRLLEIRSTNPIAVGDFVTYSMNEDGTGLISKIHDRKNYIVRRSSNLSKQSHILASNLDLVALVATINYPITSTIFIDRFLASAEAYRVPACLVFNKSDLYNEEEIEYLGGLRRLYEHLDYPVFSVSAINNSGLDEFTAFLEGKTTLMSGNSGVGKSTLINSLVPNSLAKVGEISSYHNKGMHTTTFSEMFVLTNGGKVIDTPGIKGFGVVDMESEEISHYFKDIFKISSNCRFSNCSHLHEPGCAVLEALEKQQISSSRYQSYLSMINDCDSGKYR